MRIVNIKKKEKKESPGNTADDPSPTRSSVLAFKTHTSYNVQGAHVWTFSVEVCAFCCRICTCWAFFLTCVFYFKVLKQRREADAALFSELHRKLQSQVSASFSPAAAQNAKVEVQVVR